MKVCFVLVVTVVSVVIATVVAQCPDGGAIYAWGIDENGKRVVVAEHNRYRQMVLNGQVPGQPRGKNILMINGFDNNLSKAGRSVSKQCRMNHVLAKDERWEWVGQNLYISWSSVNSANQDWAAAVAGWFDEYKNFVYPNGSNGGVTGHYTQVVWDNSSTLGCDFIRFFDKSRPQTPYAKLYTCNYGPGGNWAGQAPYQLA